MSIYLGDFQYGAVIYVYFNTFSSVGASVTLTGLAVTDIEVYKNGGVTQRASDAGYTLLDTDGIDFDATTGIHGFSIDTSDNTTAGFWAPGSDYTIVIASVTVDAQTVNFVAATFSLENRYSAGVLLRTTIATLASQTSFTLTAGSVDNDAYNGATIVISDQASVVQKAIGVILDYTGSTKTVTMLNDPAIFTMATGDYVTIIANRALKATVENRTLDVSTGGEAGLDWANIGSPTTAQNLSGTNIDVDQVVASVSGNVTGSVGSVASGGITAASLASDTITAAKIAADAFTAAKFAAGAFDAVWTVTTRELTAFSTALALSVWHVLESAIVTASTIGLKVKTNLDAVLSTKASQTSVDDLPTNAELATALAAADDAVLSAIATVQSDTDNIQTRLPTSLTSGRIDASIGALAAGVITSASIVDGAITPIKMGYQSGTVVTDGANTAQTFKTNLTASDNNHWKFVWIRFTSGVLTDQIARITNFNATTDFVICHRAFTQIPTAGDTFDLVNW